MAAVKYKPGDEVMVRPDLSCNTNYSIWATRDMVGRFAGAIVTISDLTVFDVDTYAYKIKEDLGEWGWTDEMFAPVPDDEELEDSGYSISYLFGGTGEGK